jgi:hypothetical protein
VKDQFPKNKKSSSDKSDELLNMLNGYFEAVNLTYRSASRRMELAPFLLVIRVK